MNEEALHSKDHEQDHPRNTCSKTTVISKYRTFLHKNRFALQIVEDLVSRSILYYAPSSHHNDDSKAEGGGGGTGRRSIMPESLYAWINLWTFMNDAIYYGLGNDNGLTAGGTMSNVDASTFSPSSPSSSSSNNNNNNDMEKRRNMIITSLRIVLSIVDCIAPAIEVRAHYHQQYQNQHRTNQKQKDSSKTSLHLLNVITKIERIRFICRIAILLFNYYNQYKKVLSIQKEQSNNNIGSTIDKSYLSMFGIVKDGGLIQLGGGGGEGCDYDHDEIKRVKRLLYVGKRTGRKVSYTPEKQYQQSISTSHNIIQSISKRFDSTTFKICLLAFGEILHLSRPLYQSYALRYCERQFQLFKDSDANTARNNSNRRKNEQGKRKMFLFKTWLVSIMMDLISHQFTKMGTTVNISSSNKKNDDSNNNTDSHDRTSNNQSIDIASSMTKDELYHRKMRLMLYLLRTPVFDFATMPIAKVLSHILNAVPLVGRPASNYVMDLIMYWHDWHFMMEK